MVKTNTDEVIGAANKIVSDFGNHQRDTYFSNFSEDATFIFYTHDKRLESRKEYENLWDDWEKNDGFRVHSCKSSYQKVQLVNPEVAIFSHYVETEVELGGEKNEVMERETIVFVKRSESWIAVHEHLSPAS